MQWRGSGVRVDVQSWWSRFNEEGWNSLESAVSLRLVLNLSEWEGLTGYNGEGSCHYCHLIGDCATAAVCSQLAVFRMRGRPSPCLALVHARMPLTAGRQWHLQLPMNSSPLLCFNSACLYTNVSYFFPHPLSSNCEDLKTIQICSLH